MNFKYYNQNQTVLFPYSFEELIPDNRGRNFRKYRAEQERPLSKGFKQGVICREYVPVF